MSRIFQLDTAISAISNIIYCLTEKTQRQGSLLWLVDWLELPKFWPFSVPKSAAVTCLSSPQIFKANLLLCLNSHTEVPILP